MELYVHQTQGRTRVRSLYIRCNPKIVAEKIKQFSVITGITEVQHRLHAGSVTILYDHQRISADAVMDMIKESGWLKEEAQVNNLRSQALQQVMQRGAKTLLKGIAINALKKTFGGTLVSVALAMKG